MCRSLNSDTSANSNLHFKTSSYLEHIIAGKKTFNEKVSAINVISTTFIKTPKASPQSPPSIPYL